jgi:hypothetical protein
VYDAAVSDPRYDELDAGLHINRRIRIGHADDGGKSARRGGPGPGGDRFRPFLTRFAEMGMHVD